MSILSISDNAGGASRAAYRLYRALRSKQVSARMMVHVKKTDDWTVSGPSTTFGKARKLLRSKFGAGVMRLQTSPNLNMHSVNLLPSNLAASLNRSDADVVNLHWVAGEMMSIEDLGRLRKPVIWTLHDMWAFCGAEHVTEDGPQARWRTGYRRENRAPDAGGLDLDRYTWLRKQRAWTRAFQIVTPSQWLANCVQSSSLMKDWPVSVIPNVLDLTVFKPLDQAWCRHVLNLPVDGKIVLFGAQGGARDQNKGYDLLVEALTILNQRRMQANLSCMVLGQSEPQHASAVPYPVRWMGQIGDDFTLALLYGAADVVIIPSRRENLPQSGTEAHACGCPVVAFNCTGLPDVVEHGVTGYLAEPYRPEDLARGIAWVLEDRRRAQALGAAARERAERLWSAASVIPAYLDAYAAARAAGGG
ncbi:glycosyltransferase [Massilia horti]|uniref:Glycosyltransferase n=1 Tax=Massilia horti TaxID=2562153 RepID=A0A4Y9TBI6_9BURK|nr:glycosyltransferase [Massilia horti]